MKKTDEQLISIIEAHRRDSLGVEDGSLSSDRARALDHYNGRPYGNEVDGRSKVVSRDLAEAVDWAMPAIMKVFTSSGAVGEFDPVGPEDEELAKQESDYTNQVIMKDNAGFMILHDAIKDTLLLKNGYVKHMWDVTKKTTEESYSGLSIPQVQQLFAEIENDGGEVEIIGQEMNEVVIQEQVVGLFDLKLKITRKEAKALIMAVPTEEVRVSKKCRGSLQESPFTEHVTRKTRSELREMGLSQAFVDELPAYNENDNSTVKIARDTTSEETDNSGTADGDRAMDEIEYCEAYVRVDADGDGIAELRMIVTVGNKIPPGEDYNKQIEAVPMTSFVMKRVPHRHVGESLDDELADLQEIKTVLNRQLLDNIYLTNNQRTAVTENVNLRDMMSSTPGGVIRVKGGSVSDSFMPVVTTPIIDKILPVIDYWDRNKESRTGITKASTGMDPDVLMQATKGAFMENLNRASQKIEMITRMLAESGVKEMFLQVHGLLVRHQDQPRMVQLRGKWVEVNPQEWRERTDLTVRVGLGTGNEEEKRQKLLLVTQLQDRMGPHGLVGPKQMYDLFCEVVQTMGFDVPEKFAMSPESPEFQQAMQQRAQQPNPQMAVEQMKIQATGQQKAQELAQQGQLEQARMQMQAQVDQHRQEVEAQQQQAKMTMERELAQFKAQLQAQLEREKAQLQAQTQIAIARINAESRLDAAQVSAQTTLSAGQESASDNAVSS